MHTNTVGTHIRTNNFGTHVCTHTRTHTRANAQTREFNLRLLLGTQFCHLANTLYLSCSNASTAFLPFHSPRTGRSKTKRRDIYFLDLRHAASFLSSLLPATLAHFPPLSSCAVRILRAISSAVLPAMLAQYSSFSSHLVPYDQAKHTGTYLSYFRYLASASLFSASSADCSAFCLSPSEALIDAAHLQSKEGITGSEYDRNFVLALAKDM